MFWISGNRRSPREADGEDLSPNGERKLRLSSIVHTGYSERQGMNGTYPASASVPVVEQQPAWTQSEALGPEHAQQAGGGRGWPEHF